MYCPNTGRAVNLVTAKGIMAKIAPLGKADETEIQVCESVQPVPSFEERTGCT